jgi:solute carrier family 13 (sodium-dependent dicarboxylate transporter), member 2/3/5
MTAPARVAPPQLPSRDVIALLVGVALATAAFLMTGRAATLGFDARWTLGVFMLVITLWIGSRLQPYAVGLMGCALLAFGLATPLFPNERRMEVESFAGQFASTALVMTLAGMMLAAGAVRTGVDRAIAIRLLGPALADPRRLVILLILLGATLSMFMSNTATAVLLLALVGPLVQRLGPESRSARAVVLAAALGAAIGGLATPIGTSPNIIMFGSLRENGHAISFLGWIAVSLPVAVVALLFVGWRLIRLGDGFRGWLAAPPSISAEPINARGWVWLVVFAVTILLWCLQPWTGVSIMVASLVPIALLPMAGIIRGSEMREVDWSTLLLMGSGLSLGHAMEASGLAGWLVAGAIGGGETSSVMLIAIFCLLAVAFSTFMSNTAAANLLLPMALAMPDRALVIPCAMAAALGSSLAVGLPISTPPVLLAFGMGMVRRGELLRLGVGVGLIGTVAVVIAVWAHSRLA